MTRARSLLLLPLAAALGCSEATPPRLNLDGSIVVDAARPDASGTDADVPVDTGVDAGADADLDGAIDGSSDGAIDGSSDGAIDGAIDASADAGLDAGVAAFCTVGSSVVLTSSGTTSTFEPAVHSIDDELVVVWAETRAGDVDLFARRVPATGSAGQELQLTEDAFVESQPTLRATATAHVVAFRRDTGFGGDVATLAFDPITVSLGGSNDVVSDTDEDRLPTLVPMLDGLRLYFDRTSVTSGAVVLDLSENGTPSTALALVSSTQSIAGSVAVDTSSSDPRLFFRVDGSTLGSIALDTNGVETSPDPGSVDTPMPSGVTLGTRIRTTPADATPRMVLASGVAGTRGTVVLQRLTGSGARTGTAFQVDTTRNASAPSITVHGGYAVVAYRARMGSASEGRLALVRANGTIAADVPVLSFASPSGALELVALGDGSGLALVYDDDAGSNRQLVVARLACMLP